MKLNIEFYLYFQAEKTAYERDSFAKAVGWF